MRRSPPDQELQKQHARAKGTAPGAVWGTCTRRGVSNTAWLGEGKEELLQLFPVHGGVLADNALLQAAGDDREAGPV